MRLPRDVAPAARARRALLFDGLAALALTVVAMLISAGVGILGFAGALVAILLLAWVAIEFVGLAVCRRSPRARRRRPRR
ncbi:MAG TPA: hypothetical protein VGI73_11850 [Solirubrobacterales bacterium]